MRGQFVGREVVSSAGCGKNEVDPRKRKANATGTHAETGPDRVDEAQWQVGRDLGDTREGQEQTPEVDA